VFRRLGRHRAFPVALAVVLCALPAAGYFGRTIDRLELDTVDARFAVRGPEPPPADVLVVGFDDRSLSLLGLRPPFPRRVHARVIDELHRLGARVIGYDFQFTSATDARDDLALYDAAGRAHNVVFATVFTDRHGKTNVLGGDANLRRIGAVAGHTGLPADKDGVVRRFPFALNGLPTFAVAIARRAGVVPRSDEFGSRGAWIDFPGGTGQLPQISAVDLLRHRVAKSKVSGRIVIVGATSAVLQDIHATPTSGTMAGPEIQASAVESLLAGLPLRPAPDWIAVLLIVALGVAPALLAFLLGRPVAVAASVVLLAAFLVLSQVAFAHGTIVPIVYPLLAWLVGAAAGVGGGYVQANTERDRLRKKFADFDPAIVDAVLAVQAGADDAVVLDPEAVIAGYRIEQLIGRGGMGVVYEAVQLSLGRPVALKLIRPVFAENSVARERFKRESRLAASIEHPNVIPVYEAGEYEGVLFIAMRLVDGQDLASLITLGVLDPARASELVVQIAAALDAAHAAGLVHRDVKPGNILISSDEAGEHAYLTDFGLTKRLDAVDGLTTPGRFIGTIDYMSPEQIRGGEVGPASDVYSLGCVVYHALGGRPPFDHESDADVLAAHLHEPPPNLPPDLEPLEPVLARALTKDAADRFASASEFARELAAAVGQLQLPERFPEPMPRTGTFSDTGSATAPGVALSD
jgi:CHASE2 domain-containing sensor protein